ncbi:winged-helix domain-containing protein [Patescibacteria group bacterium]|nr:winged-helix domain-containing protein [Patescibacteria group bacterium]MBU1702975.1 winged-helix domain-containing protein [Patescibacteria group bacterium]MBU1954110.1 winged-helix domain-containing protein [Patescibacteria group bacterium]
MQSLIITDNLRQAEFLQKGFLCENLSADICFFEKVSRLQDQLIYYDGVFIFLEDYGKIREYVLFCRNLKPEIPVFILLHSDTPDLRNLLQELRPDYHAVRPFSFRCIASEMRNDIFQKKEKIENSRFILRDLELDVLSRRVVCNGKEIRLRNKEFALLHFFMMNKGKVLSRLMALEHVWDRNADLLTNTVDVHISQLRKKIGKCSDDTYIHTVPCSGYLMV